MHHHDEDDDAFSVEHIAPMMEKLDDEAKKLGLYIQGYGVTQVPDMEGEPIEHEDGHMTVPAKKVVAATFLLGDLAFTDRVQFPEKFEQDEQTRLMMKQMGVDDEAESLKQELQRRIDNGEDIFGE